MKELLPRDIDILSLLISEYVATAAPVASTTLASRGEIGLSSATVRNVLAKLEETGLLTHPHTSSGKIPTSAGLRYYVNTILNKRVLSEEEQLSIERQLGSSKTSMEEILKRTGKILSMVSNYTGLVVLPKSGTITFKHVEFLPISAKKILGIFVTREGTVHNRMIDVGGDFTYSDLEKVSNYCNRAFYGYTLDAAIQKVAKELEEEQVECDRLLSHALLWSRELFSEASADKLVVEGETSFLDEPEFSDIDKLKQVMDALEEKKGILYILNRAAESDEICVFIGGESNYDAVSNCSIVTTPYKKQGQILGTLGVIGPVRMDYSHVIPTVDFTAKIVSSLLEA